MSAAYLIGCGLFMLKRGDRPTYIECIRVYLFSLRYVMLINFTKITIQNKMLIEKEGRHL